MEPRHRYRVGKAGALEGGVFRLGEAVLVPGEKGGDQPRRVRREGAGHRLLQGTGPVGGEVPQGDALRPRELRVPLGVGQ